MTAVDLANRITSDPETIEKIAKLVEAHPGIAMEKVLSGVENCLNGFNGCGFSPSRDTILFAVNKVLREADGDSLCNFGKESELRETRHGDSPNKDTRTGDQQAPLSVLTLGELLSLPVPDTEWLVEGVLPPEGIGIIAGQPGCGKTWMLADLMLEMSRGGKWLGRFPTKKGTVLCIDEESPRGLLPTRYRKLLLAKGIDAERLDAHLLLGQGFSFSNPSHVTQLRDVLSRLRPILIIVDSLIRVHSAEENSASEMSTVFAVVKAIAREFHCAFLFADHMRKGKPGETGLDQVRGSTEKAAFVDLLLVLRKTEVGIVIEHVKSRFAEALPGFAVALEDPAPEKTTIRYLGDADTLKHEKALSKANPIIEQALAHGEPVSRKDIVSRAGEAGVTRKAIDAALKALVEERKIQRDDRRPEGGKGNKLAFYRLVDDDCAEGSAQQDSVPDFNPTNDGETGTGSGERENDPVPGSPSFRE